MSQICLQLQDQSDGFTKNGDIVIANPLSADVYMVRNNVWYLKIEFPKNDLHGLKMTNEALFKVDLNFAKGQKFRVVYHKFNKLKETITCYATHVFFDSQNEVYVYDNRTYDGTWDGAINTANSIITKAKPKSPYVVHGKSDSGETNNCYWEQYNLIQCLFGDRDNSLINRWKDTSDDEYTTAMFDNYDCYFGDNIYYPSKLKRNDIYLYSNSIVMDYTKTITMEDVITGIIPKGYDGIMLPNDEIVQGSLWDKYKIHRIQIIEYSDVKSYKNIIEYMNNVYKSKDSSVKYKISRLKTYVKEWNKAYPGHKLSVNDSGKVVYNGTVLSSLSSLTTYDTNAYREELRRLAKIDLKKIENRLPKRDGQIEIATISEFDANKDLYMASMKINDRIHFRNLEGDEETHIFYFKSVTYSLIYDMVTKFEMVESE